MLQSNYGALSLGKTLRRPIMTTVKEVKATATMPASYATENTSMRKTVGSMGTRALSSNTTRPSTTPPQPQSRTWSPNNGIVFSGAWSPNHGIIFRSPAGAPRSLSTSAVEGIKQDQLHHSHTEDNYVDSTVLERQSTIDPKITVEEDLKETSASVPIPKKSEEPNEPEQVDPTQNELPETTTGFKMTEELFRKAKNAEPGSRESFWSHTLYRGPLGADGKPQRTTVHYCKSILTTERVLSRYFSDARVLGFDIEWKENAYRSRDAKSNVSLIQIANEERIALFHIALYPKHELVSPALKKIMEDPNITKVGVSIKADCTRLRKHMAIDSRGTFELSHLYKLVKFSQSGEFDSINRRLVSLAKQTQEHLHLPMFKGDVRVSDWSKPLNLDQIMYAASDSYAGLQLYHTLEMKRERLEPCPPRPYHAELNLPIRLAEGVEIPSEGEEVEVEEVEPKEPKTKYSKQTKAEVVDTEGISLEDSEASNAETKSSTTNIGREEPDEHEKPLFSRLASSLVHTA